MKPVAVFYICAMVVSMGIFSCQRELSCYWCTQNQPPIAIAGRDTSLVLPADSLILDGSASTDPDGQIVYWRWTRIAGPSSTRFSDSIKARTTVRGLTAGTYLFMLTIQDNGGLVAKDTVQLTVDDRRVNHPPVANAGTDLTLTLPANTIELNGSASSDPENNITTYAWTKITGPASFNIANANASKTQVNNLAEGIYTFGLMVTDAGGLTDKDTVQVSVYNQSQCASNTRPTVQTRLSFAGQLSKSRYGVTVASAGNKILFAGGRVDSNGISTPDSRVDIYDVITNTWSTAELSVGRYWMAATATTNKVFFGGGEMANGFVAADAVDIYDVATNTWSATKLSIAGSNIAAAASGNKVFFVGGQGGSPRERTMDIYDASTKSWSIKTLSEPKTTGASVLAWNNKIMIAGGTTYSGTTAPYHSKKVEIYDIATGSWALEQGLFEGKSWHGGIVVSDKFYWAGGYTGIESSYTLSCLVEIWDPVTARTSSLEHLTSQTSWFYPGGQQLVLKDNKILFFRTSGTDKYKFDIYDLATKSWSIGILPQTLAVLFSFVSVNNSIYLLGSDGGANGSYKVWKLEF